MSYITSTPHLGKDEYSLASKKLAILTGHEFIEHDKQKRALHFADAIAYVNEQAGLGLNKEESELFSLFYTSLSDSKRFAKNNYMDDGKGENSATHSLQAIILKDRIFSEAARSAADPRRKDALDFSKGRTGIIFNQHSRLVGLGLLMHDMGEILGEFSTLHQRANNEALEEDPQAERRILAFMLREAIAAQEAGDPDQFAETVAYMRKKANLTDPDTGAPRALSKAKEEIDALLSEPQSPLSEAGESRLKKWLAVWDMAETGKAPEADAAIEGLTGHINIGFVNQMVKSLDHVQGTRHIIRMARKDSQITGLNDEKKLWSQANEKEVAGNFKYLEGEQAGLFSSLPRLNIRQAPTMVDGRILHELARSQAGLVYRTARDAADILPPTNTAEALIVNESAGKNLTDAQRKRLAQGALMGVYARAADLVERGQYVPAAKNDGKTHIIANEGVPISLQMALKSTDKFIPDAQMSL